MGALGDALIRVDKIRLGLKPLDVRAGTESALALVLGLPWQRMGEHGVITVV